MSATTFEPFPSEQSPDYYRMFSAIAPDSEKILEGVRDIEGFSITEGVRRVLGIHKWQTDARAAGSLLIAQGSDRVEVLTVPAVTPVDIQTAKGLRINVNPDVRNYVHGQLEKDDSLEATLAFWQGVFGFYSDVRERQLLGARFFTITRDLTWGEYKLDDPYQSSDPRPRRWRR